MITQILPLWSGIVRFSIRIGNGFRKTKKRFDISYISKICRFHDFHWKVSEELSKLGNKKGFVGLETFKTISHYLATFVEQWGEILISEYYLDLWTKSFRIGV